MQKLGVINALVNKAIRIYDGDHIEHEFNHLLSIFKKNGYENKQFKKFIAKAGRGPHPRNQEERGTQICLPFI